MKENISSMTKTQFVKSMVLNAPYLIPTLLKDPSFDRKITNGIMYKMIPFRTSIEIEHSGSPLLIDKIEKADILYKKKKPYSPTKSIDFGKIYNVRNYSFTHLGFNNYFNETVPIESRISIHNYTQLAGLYKALHDLKQNCFLNTMSGTHIHVDVTRLFNKIRVKKKPSCCRVFYGIEDKDCFIIKKYLENNLIKIESIFPKYTGKFNRRGVNVSIKGKWVNIRPDLDSIEFRIGPPTFEYTDIVKYFIGCNQIVKGLYKKLGIQY